MIDLDPKPSTDDVSASESVAPGPAPGPVMIRTEGLSKTYPKGGVEALSGVDMEIHRGEVFCLLGPNGAGKTTLTRIIATQLKPTSGTAYVAGHDLATEMDEVRHRLAVVPQRCYPDYELKVWESVFYYLVARGMGWRKAKRATREIVDQLGLGDKYNELILSLSGGMMRRVLLCMALATEAEVMLLDEPTAGLDVLLRRELWDRLTVTKGDRTVLLTTHSMEEAESLADRIGILGEGELVACGTVNELRALAPGEQKVVINEGDMSREDLERFGYLQRYAGKWAVFPAEQEALHKLLDVAIEARVETSVLNTSLEDVFVYLVGDRRGTRLKLGELK